VEKHCPRVVYELQSANHIPTTIPGVRQLALVCVGGAFGSGARYLVAVGAARWAGVEFPYGTLAVNLTGSFLIGLVQQLAAATAISEDSRLLLATGVLGGLTTYSAFSYETLRLAQLGAWRAAVTNAVLTTVLCLALCAAGMALGRLLTR
jgi:fluoride exporter